MITPQLNNVHTCNKNMFIHSPNNIHTHSSNVYTQEHNVPSFNQMFTDSQTNVHTSDKIQQLTDRSSEV